MKQLFLVLAMILVLALPVYAYTGELHVKPGDYVYIRGDPATVNGRIPPTYLDAAVLVSDQGCIYTGLQQPYAGSTIEYGDGVAAHYNLHSATGELHLTPGRYFTGIQLDLGIPVGYTGSLMYGSYGNGTHLIMHLCLNNNCFPAIWKLPVTLPVTYKTVSGLGTGWYIGAYGPSQGLVLNLDGIKVLSVKGGCPTPSTSTSNPSTTSLSGNTEDYNNAKALVALGVLPILLAALIYTLKH